MRYVLWFKISEQYRVRQGRLLSEITEPCVYKDGLVTAVLLNGSLKRKLSEQAVFGELKEWKNKKGEKRPFVRIDNHQTGRYILTPFRLEDVLARGSSPINQRTDFQRVELVGENVEDIFVTYDKELAYGDTRPFVLAQQNAML